MYIHLKCVVNRGTTIQYTQDLTSLATGVESKREVEQVIKG